jgi:hypothetical protein
MSTSGHGVIDAKRDTFVVKPGRGRVVLQTLGLVFPAGVFLALAAFAILAVIKEVDSGLGRTALIVVALALVALAAFCRFS